MMCVVWKVITGIYLIGVNQASMPLARVILGYSPTLSRLLPLALFGIAECSVERTKVREHKDSSIGEIACH